jgi:hypothetical protein
MEDATNNQQHTTVVVAQNRTGETRLPAIPVARSPPGAAASLLQQLIEWATSHLFVRVSPIANGMLLINETHVPQLLCEVFICKLCNKMIMEIKEGAA